MTTYSTGNPVGSPDPRDLYDNAENLDEAINSTSDEWTDRLGRTRFTIEGVTNLATDLGTAAYRDTVGLGDVYAREGILGTVSQSGGVPTGAIIERGSNDDGEYTIFADLMMICRARVVPDWTQSGIVLFNTPRTFNSNRAAASYSSEDQSEPFKSSSINGISVREGAWRLSLDGTGSNSGETVLNLVAIGYR